MFNSAAEQKDALPVPFTYLGDRKNLAYFQALPGYAGAIRLTHDELKTRITFPDDAPLMDRLAFHIGIHRVPPHIRTIYVERKAYYLSFFMQCVDVYGLTDRKVILFENRDGRIVDICDNFSGSGGFAVLGSRENLKYFKDRPGFIAGIYSGTVSDDELVLSLRDTVRVAGFPETIYVEDTPFYLNYYIRHAGLEGILDRKLKLFKVSGGVVEERDYEPRADGIDGAGAPARVYEIDLVNQCNLKCRMCHISYMGDRKTQCVEIDQLRGVKNVFIQMGGVYEPLMHKDFPAIARMLSDNGCELSIITNATLLTPALIAELAGCNFYSIHVSFDSADKKIYEGIRRGARFEKTRQNILDLRSAFRGKDTMFMINMVVMKGNMGGLREMADFAEAAGFDGLGLIPMVVRSSGADVVSQSLDPIMDEANGRFDECAEHVIKNSYRIVLSAPYFLYTPLRSQYPKNVKNGIVRSDNPAARTYFNKYTAYQLGRHPGMKHNCVSPFTFAKIGPDGAVYLCNELLIGNVNSGNIMDIWNGRAASYIRRFIMDNPLLCQDCDRYKYCLNPRAASKYNPDNIAATSEGRDRLKKIARENLRPKAGFDGVSHSLAEAMMSGDGETVKRLAPEADAFATDGCASTLLLYAALYGCEEAAEILIEMGADVNAKNRYSDTPLTAALLGGRMGIVRLLAGKGADVNHAFAYAMAMNNLDWAALLAGLGADVNGRLSDGLTHLVNAAINNDMETASFLVAKGADADSADENGSTALIHAALNGLYEMAGFLIESGADVNRKNLYFDTPLSVAAAHGRRAMAEFLAAKGARLDDALVRVSVIDDARAAALLTSLGGDANVISADACK
ncbi:MAG: ankyrin repeat domain-containing protein [Deltaproteobacteria bacterium]|nr:ankyrin repeat domain-containing protein [Deltaproteobacteria bacterium]